MQGRLLLTPTGRVTLAVIAGTQLGSDGHETGCQGSGRPSMTTKSSWTPQEIATQDEAGRVA